MIHQSVALRKESVDRNVIKTPIGCVYMWSLSARRAWIEIVNTADQEARKRSLSARRAWIEISLVNTSSTVDSSLSARRAWIEISRLDAEY